MRSWIVRRARRGLQLRVASRRASRRAGCRGRSRGRGRSPASPSRSTPRAMRAQVAHVAAVELDRAARRVVEPRDQVGDRRLAGAARPDERGELAGLDLERDVLERPRAASTVLRRAAPRSGTRRRAARPRRARRSAARRRRVRRIDDLVSAGRGSGRSARTARATTAPRPTVWSMLPIGNSSRVCSAVNATIVPELRSGLAGDEVDERGRDREERLHDREEGAPDHLLAHLEPRQPLVLVAIALDRVTVPVEHLREQDARRPRASPRSAPTARRATPASGRRSVAARGRRAT